MYIAVLTACSEKAHFSVSIFKIQSSSKPVVYELLVRNSKYPLCRILRIAVKAKVFFFSLCNEKSIILYNDSNDGNVSTCSCSIFCCISFNLLAVSVKITIITIMIQYNKIFYLYRILKTKKII